MFSDLPDEIVDICCPSGRGIENYRPDHKIYPFAACLHCLFFHCYGICWPQCGSLSAYLWLPCCMPMLCWPILGVAGICEGFFRSLYYSFLSTVFAAKSLALCNPNHWLTAVITLRESILLCGGACGLVVPCNMCFALYVDPDGEESPNVHNIWSLCGKIDARRFSVLWNWPKIWGGDREDIGHPPYAFLGKLRPPGSDRLSRQFVDRSSCPPAEDWACSDLRCCPCCQFEGELIPFFPDLNHTHSSAPLLSDSKNIIAAC